MVNYLNSGCRMAGQFPRMLAGPNQSLCRFHYADARSLLRSYGGAGPGDDPDFFKRPIAAASSHAGTRAAGALASMLQLPAPNGIGAGDASRRFGGGEFEVVSQALVLRAATSASTRHPLRSRLRGQSFLSGDINGDIASRRRRSRSAAGHQTPSGSLNRTLIHCPSQSLVGWARNAASGVYGPVINR